MILPGDLKRKFLSQVIGNTCGGIESISNFAGRLENGACDINKIFLILL